MGSIGCPDDDLADVVLPQPGGPSNSTHFGRYLQVDVLESQWQKLVDGVQASRDFEEVHILHDKYLESVIEQCFLRVPDVRESLLNVLHMCS